MKRLLSGVAVVPVMLIALSAPAFADANPAGTGQPGTATTNGVACGNSNASNMPPGFSTQGFAHAGSVYAGASGSGSLNSGNSHAVAEYDIACYQHTQNAK